MFTLIFGTVALLTTSGCATGPTPRSTAAAFATERGAPPQLVTTMQRGGRLTLADVQKLANLQIPDDVTLAYLRDSGAAYELTTAQIDQMRAAGVSVRVIDYLLSTPSRVASRYRGNYGGGLWLHGYGYYGRGYYGHGLGHGSFRHGGRH